MKVYTFAHDQFPTLDRRRSCKIRTDMVIQYTCCTLFVLVENIIFSTTFPELFTSCHNTSVKNDFRNFSNVSFYNSKSPGFALGIFTKNVVMNHNDIKQPPQIWLSFILTLLVVQCCNKYIVYTI